MILLVALGVSAVGLLVARVGLPAVRRRRLRAELRGDWWARFEHEFRAYASRSCEAPRDAERRAW